jgi:carboxyl-terminal processing protease
LPSGSLYAQPSPQPSYPELFNLVWQTINENFYDPSFGGVDWKKVRQKYSPEVAKLKDDRSFGDLAYRMMRELQASHLYLSPGQARRVGIGIRTSVLEDQLVITQVAVGSDAQRKNVRVGDVLLDQGRLSGPSGTSVTVHVKGCDGNTCTLEVRRENAWWPPEHPSLRWHTIEQGGEQASRRRIGYITAGRFDDDAAPLIDAAMEAVKDTYGLIIDLRDSSGGNISCIRPGGYFSQPKIQNLSVVVARNHDVVGLEIAMNNSRSMSFRQPLRDLNQILQQARERRFVSVDLMAKRVAFTHKTTHAVSIFGKCLGQNF